MSRQNATLSGSLTDQEEVIKISSLVANKVAINNRTARWIFDWKIRGFNLRISNTLLKEPLIDALVYNN